MTEPAKHSVSVAGVIVNDEGQVLLIRRRDNGHWEPPGGILGLDESITEGLHREVQEETGLMVDAEALTGVYKNMRIGVVALVFRCQVLGGSLQTNAEVTEFRWVAPGALPEIMSPAFSVRVTDALTERYPTVRAHDGEQLV
ncbi:NUDIX hydrolase [Streptodolium elevatio]